MRVVRAAIAAFFCAAALAACDQITTGDPTTEEAAAPKAAPAEAAQTNASPAYVGTWAADTASCAIPQEQAGAPYVFHADGYDQHEAHCTFAMLTETGPNAWRAAAACQVEGDEQSTGWDMSVEGDTMTMDGARLVRCPS
jgi:hypothetical protein